MLRKILIYGTLAGLIAGVPLSLFVLTYRGEPPASGMAIGYTLMLIAFSLIFLAIKRQRDEEGGGVIRFWPALALGLGISIVAGIFYVVAWEVSCAIAHLDFGTSYANAQVAAARARGVRGAELAAVVAQWEQFKVQYANPAYRWPMTFAEIFPVGVIVSLISAALLRNPRILPARRADAYA